MARKDYIIGSGNVFEDLGHPRPAEALAKMEAQTASLFDEFGSKSPETAEMIAAIRALA